MQARDAPGYHPLVQLGQVLHDIAKFVQGGASVHRDHQSGIRDKAVGLGIESRLGLAETPEEPCTRSRLGARWHLANAADDRAPGNLRVDFAASQILHLPLDLLGYLVRRFLDGRDRKSKRLNSSHERASRMPYSARNKIHDSTT